MGRPLVLDPAKARRLGSSYELLVPFLEQGATAVVVPIATPAELLATLTVVSLDPERRIGKRRGRDGAVRRRPGRARDRQREAVPAAEGLRRHDAAIAAPAWAAGGRRARSRRRLRVVGARRGRRRRLRLPDAPGRPPRGRARRRQGHGIEATADMALAKFAFRSLVRALSRPGRAPRAGERGRDRRACRRELRDDGFASPSIRRQARSLRRVRAIPRYACSLPTGRLGRLRRAGSRSASRRTSATRARRDPRARGGSLPLHGRARRGAARDDQYGEERLDAALAAGRDLPAQALAEHVVADARAFAGEPEDDYAVVVIRRTSG